MGPRAEYGHFCVVHQLGAVDIELMKKVTAKRLQIP
jgi:hypothetical protein